MIKRVASFLLVAAVIIYLADRNGYNRARTKYNAEAAELALMALDEQTKLQEEYNALENTMQKALADEKSRYQQFRRDIGKRNPSSLLDKARSHPALPETGNTGKFIPKKGPIKPDDLTDYALYCVSEYNKCAIELNSAIDVIKTIQAN